MAHQTFKVCILLDDNVENFYIKHYIDQINPVFSRFKTQVFQRNPNVNSPNLKIYWIDAENDQILVSCEEDFRLFLEEGKGRKIFFSVSYNVQQNEEEESIPMESSNTGQQPERKSRKVHKEDEKRCRKIEKLSKKLRHYEREDSCEQERSRCKKFEKREFKTNERLERAKRRVEQIRSIIGSIDPANLNSSYNANNNNAEPTPSTSTSNDTNAQVHSPISPETIRLLSNAIAGCLQPCNVINKVLNEVFAIIPQVVEQTTGVMNNVDQQLQTTEVPKNTSATNTSDANTPIPINQASQEIEELFKEAAKELEKMNEIVNNSKMESSTSSTTTGVTQIERVFQNITDSAMSDATFVNLNESQCSSDQHDSSVPKPATNDEFKTATPPKFARSRESSIEIHDVNSVMSDDSRDWTLLSQDELSIEPAPARSVDPKSGAIPKGSNIDSTFRVADAEIQTNETKNDSVKSIETQTPQSLLSGYQELQESVKKSLDMFRESFETSQKSVPTNIENNKVKEAEAAVPVVQKANETENKSINIYPTIQPTAPEPTSTSSQANINASLLAPSVKPQTHQKFEPAVVVFDPNPKINAAVHTMMNMGFSNEDNWLTQLLLNVDGDIAKALNFLTPQPKNRKP